MQSIDRLRERQERRRHGVATDEKKKRRPRTKMMRKPKRKVRTREGRWRENVPRKTITHREAKREALIFLRWWGSQWS
jgi:hypothetical protein